MHADPGLLLAHRYSPAWWSLACFARPDTSCSHFTVANIHIECAKRRSVCVALLLRIRDLCAKLSAVILTGDLNKAAERELSAGGSDSQRRVSPLEAAFNHANIPWPTCGATPLWGLGGERLGGTWPDCCGFVVLADSQCHWLIMRHGSINAVTASIGQSTTDQTWHQEQGLHLKFAESKRRRDASPADSKSQQKTVLHTNK